MVAFVLLINYFARVIDLVIFDALGLKILGTAVTRLVEVQLMFLSVLPALFLLFSRFFVSV